MHRACTHQHVQIEVANDTSGHWSSTVETCIITREQLNRKSPLASDDNLESKDCHFCITNVNSDRCMTLDIMLLNNPSILLSVFGFLVCAASTTALRSRDVYENYPYKGPAIPIADWLDQTVNGNGKGFVRLNEPPAVWPANSNATNNINTVSLAFIPGGMNIHFSTPFGIGGSPIVNLGTSVAFLNNTAIGKTSTYAPKLVLRKYHCRSLLLAADSTSISYDRTPPCSAFDVVTLCSQFFHDVQISGLAPNTEYFYQILGGNGTSPSPIWSFRVAPSAGDVSPFSVAVVNDMGYTNAEGTHAQLVEAITTGSAFVWHGGDLSYADDWFNGILPCVLNGTGKQSHCYNGTDSYQPYDGDLRFSIPLPSGAEANQGSPQGGDMSVMYETNWDLWQNWMNSITTRVPYMTLPGNHEATCSERDGPNHELSAYLEDDVTNGTASNDTLNYYSCPASQR